MTEASASRLVSILRDPDHGQAIQDDLRSRPFGAAGVDARDRARSAQRGRERWSRRRANGNRTPCPARAGTGLGSTYHEKEEAGGKPMTEGFQTVLAASEQERRDLFLGAANRLRTNEQNIEKDFWVCWTLDALFNELEAGGPRLLFKGGTSLSKGYGLIERFSEDIDITVFREDIGQPATVEELEATERQKAQRPPGGHQSRLPGVHSRPDAGAD